MQNIVPYINIKLTYCHTAFFNTFRGNYSVGMAGFVRKFNSYLFFKLPAAWWCGVRLEEVGDGFAQTAVRLRWMNQNPFRSMFWAVQGMAAELSTGTLVMQEIRKSGREVSMLVLNNRAHFSKKATGRIRFRCEDGGALKEVMQQVLATGEGHTLWMSATGRNEAGQIVSEFHFEWTLKIKQGIQVPAKNAPPKEVGI